MTTLQSQARALGAPTRHAVFSYPTDTNCPVDVAELTDHLGLNHNAIRQHRRAVAATERSAAPDVDPVEVVTAAMVRNGFDPDVRRRGDRVEVLLRACPFEAAAVADPEVVCAVHLGMAEGIAELAHGRVVDALVPYDPRRHACRLRLHLQHGNDTAAGDAT